MKKLFMLAALVLTLLPMMAQKQQFTVKITAGPGATEIMWGSLTGQPQTVKATNGTATVKGEGEMGELMMAQDNQNRMLGFFVVDAAELTVDMNTDVATGGEQNRQLTEFMKLVREEKAGNADKMAAMVTQNKDRDLGAIMLFVAADQMRDELVESIIASGGKCLQHPLAQQITAKVQSTKKRKVGSTFKELTMQDTEGKTVCLSDYVGKGQWVMVDFWASWCGPCRQEMPNVVACYKQYHPKGLEIVGVSFDQKKEPWVKALGTLDMTWPQMSDLKGWQCEASKVYGINSIPASILFDPQGKVAAIDLRGPALGQKLAEIFQ